MTETEKLSYALGMNIFGNISELPVQLDFATIRRAFETLSTGGKPELSQEEYHEQMQRFQNVVQTAGKAALKAAAERNAKLGKSFLEENGRKSGVVTTASGLQYEVVREGDGASPAADDTVIVNYTLRDIDGNQIESATDAQFSLSSLIPGFAEVVQTMKVGGETIAYMHPDLAYGQNGAGSVEPNSLLIFDIELTGILEPTV